MANGMRDSGGAGLIRFFIVRGCPPEVVNHLFKEEMVEAVLMGGLGRGFNDTPYKGEREGGCWVS